MPYAYRRTAAIRRYTPRRTYRRKSNSYGRKSYKKGTRYQYKYNKSRATAGRTHFAYRKDLSVPPPKMHTIMRYCSASDLPRMTIATGSNRSEADFCINDLYHFLRAANGSAIPAPTVMPAKTEWSAQYTGYKVHMIEVMYTCVNTNDVPYYMGLSVDPQNYVPSNLLAIGWDSLIRILKSNEDYKYCILGPVGTPTSTRTLRWRVPIAKVIGNEDYRTEPNFAGGSATSFDVSPLNVINMAVLLLNYDGSPLAGPQSVICNFNCNIYCTFYAKEGEGG